jgi:hypothetical protein
LPVSVPPETEVRIERAVTGPAPSEVANAGCYPRQPPDFLRVAAVQHQGFGDEIDGRGERDRCAGAAEFLGNRAEFDMAEA